jgi:hypothetical protein
VEAVAGLEAVRVHKPRAVAHLEPLLRDEELIDVCLASIRRVQGLGRDVLGLRSRLVVRDHHAPVAGEERVGLLAGAVEVELAFEEFVHSDVERERRATRAPVAAHHVLVEAARALQEEVELRAAQLAAIQRVAAHGVSCA